MSYWTDRLAFERWILVMGLVTGFMTGYWVGGW